MLPPAAAHVFVDDLDGLALESRDAHHLRRVLRLRPGEAVTASDGVGHYRLCEWTGSGLAPMSAVDLEPRSTPTITVAFALTKGTKPEWSVQRLTEVGVDVIQPFVAHRSVVRWDDDKQIRAEERLATIAREAAMQSRRAWLPAVGPVASFRDLVGQSGADPERALAERALAQPGGPPLSLDRPYLLIGPEGGWSPDEAACGLPAVGLGPAVLRAETAAVVAGALLAALRGGLVRPAHR